MKPQPLSQLFKNDKGELKMTNSEAKATKITKRAILKELHLDKTWNKINSCFGFRVGTVLWQSKNPWKIVDTDNFDEISDWNDKSHILAEFHEQKDLCNYIFNALTKTEVSNG